MRAGKLGMALAAGRHVRCAPEIAMGSGGYGRRIVFQGRAFVRRDCLNSHLSRLAALAECDAALGILKCLSVRAEVSSDVAAQ